MISTLSRSRILLVALILAALVGAFALYQQSATATVTQTVRRDLPIVLDGEVWATTQVGNTIVVGGNFTQIQVERDGPIIDQKAIYAYDINTGDLITCLLYTSPSPRDRTRSRMPSSA